MSLTLALFSDLHTEFTKQPNLFEGLDTDRVDVAVLAGDIFVARNSIKFLQEFCALYPDVVMVAGNHEFYQSEFHSTLRHLHDTKIPNLHFLEKETAEIKGHRFIGCTLWYNGGTDCFYWEHAMNDFRFIHNINPQNGGTKQSFRQMIYKYASDSKDYLRKNVRKGDVVVTHMLPSESCIAEQYRGDPMNGFYFNDCEKIIKECKPKVWLHGHSHQFMERTIYDTRVIRNPRGYPNEPGVGFIKNFKIYI